MLLGIHSERLMDNRHAVSSSGRGSSHDFLQGLTLHLDFVMCFLKKLIASGRITTDIFSIKTPIWAQLLSVLKAGLKPAVSQLLVLDK